MKFLNLKKSLFLCIFLILTYSCNYKPLLNKDQLDKLKFQTIQTKGDKRIAQIVVNKLNILSDKTGNLIMSIEGKKKVKISNKSATGKVLEYSINLTYEVEVKNNLTKKIIYSKKISNTENYKPSSTYTDTISNERKIIENISELVSKQIINEINIVLRNDI